MTNIERAIAALTYDEVEILHNGHWQEGKHPLLKRSIANDLRQIEASLSGKGKTLLFAIAESIDEALLALAETAETK
jgi:hypothetical protein